MVAEDVENEPLAALVINRLRGVMQVCAVKAPGFGDRRKAMLQDLAILTGGEFISEDLGIKLENVEVSQLGRAKRVIVDKDNTTIVEGAGKKSDLQARIAQVKQQIETTTSDYDREKLSERLAKLAGGVAVVHVGAATELAMKEKKARVEDALHATRAATEEGIVPGGGVALLRCAEPLAKLAEQMAGDRRVGVEIVMRALTVPLASIAENSGVDGRVIVEEVKALKKTEGFDAQTGEYGDMFEKGIIDPTKVTRSALQNAASIASLMLTTETMVTELKDKKEEIEGVVR